MVIRPSLTEIDPDASGTANTSKASNIDVNAIPTRRVTAGILSRAPDAMRESRRRRSPVPAERLRSSAMDRDELAFAGVVRLTELVRAGEVSSRELTELFLGRIERLDPELNAFRSVWAERALADADQADARRGAGDERPLLGVPLAVKDTEDVAGEVTALGTARRRRARASGQRLRAPAASGRCGAGRQDQPARAGDHGQHRGPRLRGHAQPLGQRAHAGRLERRQRRRGRGRAGRRRPRHPTAPARSASPPPTAAWSASSRSAIGSAWLRAASTGTA